MGAHGVVTYIYEREMSFIKKIKVGRWKIKAWKRSREKKPFDPTNMKTLRLLTHTPQDMYYSTIHVEPFSREKVNICGKIWCSVGKEQRGNPSAAVHSNYPWVRLEGDVCSELPLTAWMHMLFFPSLVSLGHVSGTYIMYGIWIDHYHFTCEKWRKRIT